MDSESVPFDDLVGQSRRHRNELFICEKAAPSIRTLHLVACRRQLSRG